MQADRGHIVGTPGHSPALRYELRLAESLSASGPTQARIKICFEVLDELVPQFGVFQRVLKMLRDELHAAVYSDEYTSGGGRGKRPATRPERLPYFTIAKRFLEKRKEGNSKLEVEIASLKEQLYTCEADLEKASSAIEAYRHDVKDRDAKIHKLGSELRSRTSECERLQKIVNQHQRAQDRLRQEVEIRMFSLKNTIASLNDENTDLRQYKNTHDSIQKVLAKPTLFHPISADNPTATKKSEAEEQLETAEALQKQLLQMQNSLMDEYDIIMNTHIREMADEQAIETHMMLKQQQDNFKQNIAAVADELSLLQSHHHTLTTHLNTVTATLAKHLQPHEAIVVANHPANPLVAQEQVFNKYSAMLSTSSDGGNCFYALKDARFCPSCGDKTVICPHKAFAGELDVQLPLNSTHLRISRPQLRLTTHQVKSDVTKSEEDERLKPLKPASRQLGLHSAPPEFGRIWSHFRSRYRTERKIPRTLTAEQLLTLVHQFYASVLQKDDTVTLSTAAAAAMAGGEEERIPSLLESLYGFMCDRYLVLEVIPLATHDFLSGLEEHHLNYNKEFLVLSHILCGNLDGAAFRYLLLLAMFVDIMPWLSTKEFTPWAALLYPSLQEEDLEQLTMNFIAHSSNRVSKHLVMEFLTWMVLRHREPRIMEMESKLVDHPCKRPGSMMEVEFAEAMDSLVPLVPDRLCHWLFMQSLSQLREGGQGKRETVPTKRLAYIASYLSLLRAMPPLLLELEQLSHVTTAVVPPGGRPADSQLRLHTLNNVRDMASKMK